MPLILGTNSIKDTGFNVDNSLRFDDGSSDDLQRTFGTSTNTDIFTISIWVKRSTLGIDNFFVYSTGGNSDDNWFQVGWNSTDKFVISAYNTVWLRTNRLFRDVSAWYHIVIKADSSQGTASNRLKLYVNGVEETSFSDDNRGSISSSQTWGWNKTGNTGYVGSKAGNNYYDGYMAEVVMIDGTALDPTSFGEFDEDSGIWKPIDVSGLTFGNNGFYLDFENASSLGADVSGNSNNFTVNNLTSVDQSTDTCTNNFATMNPLANSNSNVVLSEGNLFVSTQTSWLSTNSTLGVSSGKWYTEIKLITLGSVRFGIGKVGTTATATNTISQTNNQASKSADGYEINHSDGNKYNNNSGASYGSAFSANDIGMIAFDADNGTIWFGKNGTWFNSATQSEIENGTTTNSAYSSITIDDFFLFTNSAETTGGGSVNGETSWNFGSPPFAISSGNADGNGYGNFEYAVPSGYYALNTKNLAEYG